MTMSAQKGKPQTRHHDPVFNLLASVYVALFQEAESQDRIIAMRARLEIMDVFSPYSLKRLHRQGFITWHPEEVRN